MEFRTLYLICLCRTGWSGNPGQNGGEVLYKNISVFRGAVGVVHNYHADSLALCLKLQIPTLHNAPGLSQAFVPPSSPTIHRLLFRAGNWRGGTGGRLIYIIKLKHASLENISGGGVRTWEMLIWDICCETPLATKLRKSWGAALSVGPREMPREMCLCLAKSQRKSEKP